MKNLNKVIGCKGEIFAQEYLKKKRYKILALNYKDKIGEIDIVAQIKKVIVFVEVKSRETIAFGRPCEAVNFEKQNKIRRVAQSFLIRNHLVESQVRFDVIEVIGDKLNHIENAF